MKKPAIHKRIAEKRVLTILIVAFIALVYSHSAAALSIENPFSSDDFGTILHKLANFVFKIGVPLLIFAIVIVGFMFVRAQGNEKELEGAKNAFFWLVIGAIIIMGAPVLADVLSNLADKINAPS